jgi:hypothetical protein
MEYLRRVFERLHKKPISSEEEIHEEVVHPGGEEEGGGEKTQVLKYDPSQILIKYRARASDNSIDLSHDFTDIPTKEELMETFGPGFFVIYVKETEDTHPKIKKRYTIEGHPILPVESYEIKVRVSEGGKLLDTDVTFPAGNPPSKEDIITALGGGGTIKLNAKGKDGRIIWSEWRDYTDTEPPEALKKKDDTFKGQLETALDAVRKDAETKTIENIKGKGGSSSRFDAAISQLTEVVEDKRFKKLEDALERFTNELKGSPAEGTQESKSLTDLAFKEPYMAKLAAQKKVIEELAKTNPAEAMKQIDRMPDGITIGLKLALAGTGLVEAFADFLKEESHSMRGRPKEKKKEVEKKEKKEEAAEEEVGRELQDRLEQKSRLGVEERVTATGFDLDFNVGQEAKV